MKLFLFLFSIITIVTTTHFVEHKIQHQREDAVLDLGAAYIKKCIDKNSPIDYHFSQVFNVTYDSMEVAKWKF